MISKGILLLAMAVSPAVLAGDLKTVTGEFTDFFNERFIGQQSTASIVWDNTFCALRNPITGKCVERGGDKIYGEGRGSVTSLLSSKGNGWIIETTENPLNGVLSVQNWVDVRTVYSYKGKTTGRKQCWPGNFHCGFHWGELSPEGRIILDISSNTETGFVVKARYEVIAGHDDKPNTVVRKAMENLKAKAGDLIQRFVRLNGSSTIVDIK